jgi:DnaJ-domain-containing protein 1
LHGVTNWRVEAILAPRSSTKQNQTPQERQVVLHYTRKGKSYQIAMGRQARAVDNLLVVWLILEALRLNEARGFAAEIAAVYRQEFPALPAAGQSGAPSTTAPAASDPYRVLFVRQDAPLAVCEAAYRALIKEAHPDTGGSVEKAQRLNVAIAAIRKEKEQE